MIAQNIYSIYLYTGLHKRKVFDKMIHIMSKRINLSIYKHQIICNHSASAGVLDKCWTMDREGQSSNPQRGGRFFPGMQMCI